MSISTYGDFDFQTVVDAYEPKLADLQPHHKGMGFRCRCSISMGACKIPKV